MVNMDPASAVGVASAVIHFFGFAKSVFSTLHEIYKSPNGLTDKNSSALEYVKSSYRGLKHQAASLGNHEGEANLERIRASCIEACMELKDAFKELRIPAQNSLPNAFVHAVKLVWKKRRLTDLQEKVDDLKMRLAVEIIIVNL